MKTTFIALLALSSLASAADPIPNRLIDYSRFQAIAAQVAPVRAQRRVTEDQFLKMASEPGTVVLDARSADKYARMHVKGAISLPFTDFTEGSLAKAIPEKTTRILIYCNNNFNGAPRALTAKAAPASLNISTYIALATYGYKNVYELGPLLDVKTTRLPFDGTDVEGR
jgi:phage shock protein E